MQLELLCTELTRETHRGFIRRDEEAHFDARRSQPCDRVLDDPAHSLDVETTFGRALLAALGNERDDVRPHALRDGEHLLGGRHLHVEEGRHRRAQSVHVLVADMPTIFAQMRRDSVRARLLTELRCEHGIGVARTACVADRGNVIDVDVKPDRQCFAALSQVFCAAKGAAAW